MAGYHIGRFRGLPRPIPATRGRSSAFDVPRIDDRHTGGVERAVIARGHSEAPGGCDRGDIAVGRRKGLASRARSNGKVGIASCGCIIGKNS